MDRIDIQCSSSYQRRQIVACLATELILVAEPQDVLNIRNEMIWVGM